MRFMRPLFLAFFVLGFSIPLAAADVSVRHELTPKSAKIGDVISYTLTYDVEGDYRPAEPELEKNTGPFRILKKWREEQKQSGRQQIRYVFHLASYQTGPQLFPAQNIDIAQEGRARTVALPAIPVTIESLLPKDKSSWRLRDIGNPLFVSTGVVVRSVTLFFLPFVILAGIIAALFWYRKRRLAQKALENLLDEGMFNDDRSPEEFALAAMKHLIEKDLLGQGAYKTFYFELSDILKVFLGRSYGAPIAEMTTTEVLAYFSEKVTRASHEKLTAFFDHSDVVKYAQVEPRKDETEALVANVYAMIELYKRGDDVDEADVASASEMAEAPSP